MALKYPDILESNNPNAYGIVRANQVVGHKTVPTLNDLYQIKDFILSDSGNNTNNDAIGQRWYVVDLKKYYKLEDWDKRNLKEGWKLDVSEDGGSIAQINATLQEHSLQIASNKTSCDENAASIRNLNGGLSEGTATTTSVPLVLTTALGGTVTATLNQANKARAGVMTAEDVKRLFKLEEKTSKLHDLGNYSTIAELDNAAVTIVSDDGQMGVVDLPFLMYGTVGYNNTVIYMLTVENYHEPCILQVRMYEGGGSGMMQRRLWLNEMDFEHDILTVTSAELFTLFIPKRINVEQDSDKIRLQLKDLYGGAIGNECILNEANTQLAGLMSPVHVQQLAHLDNMWLEIEVGFTNMSDIPTHFFEYPDTALNETYRFFHSIISNREFVSDVFGMKSVRFNKDNTYAYVGIYFMCGEYYEAYEVAFRRENEQSEWEGDEIVSYTPIYSADFFVEGEQLFLRGILPSTSRTREPKIPIPNADTDRPGIMTAAHVQQLTDAKAKVDANTTSISQIKSTLQEHTDSIAQVNTTVSSHANELSQIKHEQTEQNNRIADHDERLVYTESDLVKVREEYNSIISELVKSIAHTQRAFVVETNDKEGYINIDGVKKIIPANSIKAFRFNKEFVSGNDQNTGIASFRFLVTDTSEMTNMVYMFYGYSSLTSLDLSSFDTSAVTSMYAMFAGCKSLVSVDLSGFDTSAVTDMQRMFHGCVSLTSLDLSGFDTSAVTDMYAMFDDCLSLVSLNLSGFDTSAVTSISLMFANCVRLTSLLLGPNFFKCSAVTSIDFSSCSNWTNETVVTSLVTNSYDRAAAGLNTLTIKLHANTKAALSDEQKATITNKGYTIA